MKIFLVCLLVLAAPVAKSQSCSVPRPLTKTQQSMVQGTWSGHYQLSGKHTDLVVVVGAEEQKQYVAVSAPPLPGEPANELNRFCPNGAFHFRKELTEGSYEFDGVPEGDTIKGVLAVVTPRERLMGTFELTRTRGGYLDK